MTITRTGREATPDTVGVGPRVLIGGRRGLLRFLPASALVVDLLVMAIAGVLAVVLRSMLNFFDTPAGVDHSDLVVGPGLLIGWVLCIYVLGGYRPDVFGAGTDEYKRVLNSGMLAAGLTGAVCFVSKYSLARGFYVLFFVLGVPGLLVARLLLRRIVQRARQNGHLQQKVLILGSPSHIDDIAAILGRESWLGYHFAGALTPVDHVATHTAGGMPVLGDLGDLVSVARTVDIDVIFFAAGALDSMTQMRRILWELEQFDVQLIVAPSVTDISSERIRVRPVGGLPLMHLDPPTWSDASRIGKRTFDVVGSGLLLLLMSPFLVVVALVVRMGDGGPVFFRQTRIGRHGEQFSCLKFRSMVVDAESRLALLHQQQGHVEGLFKMTGDPRVTRVGRWLRRMSIDEVPQLVNVLRGEMSLVGPRPPLPLEVERYDADTARRLHVRPGMTGLWQVSGRSDLTWDEAIRLDLFYVDNWSMLQDVAILARTVGAVLGSRGAY